jgi:cell division protein FtsN
MGMRFTQFVDDYIDGLQVAGTSNDAMLRFYTAVRLDGGMSQKAKKAIADAESKAKELQSTLTSTLESKEASEKALDQNKKKHAQEKAQLQDEIDALKAQLTAPAPVEEVKVDGIQSPGMYHVIIGSFPTKEAAEAYAASIEGKTPEVDFIESLSTYRVSLSAHDSYAKAAATLEDAKTISSKAWIVQY